MSEKETDDIEKYVKSTLKAAIVKKENPIDFYGQYYAKNPSEFEFSPGERAQIKLVSNYVQTFIEKYGMVNGESINFSLHFPEKLSKPKT